MSVLKLWKISAPGIVLIYFSFLLISCVREPDANDIQKIKSALKQNNFKLAEELCEKYRTNVNSDNYIPNYIYFKTLLKRGKLKKADEFFNRRFRIDSLHSPIVLTDKALLKYYLGDMDSARLFARKAINSTGKDFIISRAYNVLGLISFYRGNLDSSEYYQNMAKNFALSDSSFLELANALRQLGVIAWYRGNLNKAKNAFYLPALDLYKKCGDKLGEATTLSDIGLIYFDLKNWTKNYDYQLKAMKIRIEIGDLIGLADSYCYFGTFPVSAKELSLLKLKFIEKSDSISRAIGYKWGEDIASNALSAFYSRSALLYEANTRAAPNTNASNDAQLVKRIIEFGRRSFKAKGDKIIEIGKKLIADSEKSGVEAYKFGVYSSYFRVLLNSRKFDQAKEVIEKIQKTVNSFNTKKFVIYMPEILKSDLFIARGQYDSAFTILNRLIDHFEKSYKETIETSNGILGFESIITQLYSLREYCYAKMYDLLFNLNDVNKFFHYKERQKQFSSYSYNTILSGESNSFVNYLKGILESNISETFNPYADSLIAVIQEIEGDIVNRSISIGRVNREGLHANLTSIKNLQSKLKFGQAYLNFTNGDSSVYLNVITNNKKSIVRLPGNSSQIAGYVKFLLKTIERGSKYPDDIFWRKPAAKLYDSILKPVESFLTGEEINTLIISPSGIFYHLPFAVLLSPNSENHPTPLIEKFDIIYCFSAYDFISIKQMDFQKPKSILAIAPNEKLVYSEKEVNEIPVSIFQYRKFLLGRNATTKNFKENAGLYDIIHIAGHSEVNGLNPLNSGIEFYDKTLNLIDIYKYKFSPELVILSSCQSGLASGILSDNPGSLDMFSFVRALKDIGAKSVISAGWYINDKSGAQLMINFYRHLADVKKSPMPISKALKLAQIDMFTSPSVPIFSHPFYWAGYSVTQ